MISLGLQCYGAEDDRTFGIPGEVTCHFFKSEQDISNAWLPGQ